MNSVPEQLFVFIQMEFPWQLGPPDGRYLLRAGRDAEPEHVVVIGSLTAAVARPARMRLAQRDRQARPEPATVPTSRATVIDPVSVSAERQARAWLEELDREREVTAAAAVINRVVHAHRLASADPYLHEVSPAHALVIRAGWGAGEQVADGRWLHARELAPHPPRGRRRRSGRAAALRPQERLAALLGGHERDLLCEELALRARLDLQEGRIRHAALELERAYATALPELRALERQDLAIRVGELQQLYAGVLAQAQVALAGGGEQPDEEVVTHALGRLEAALRARTAAGLTGLSGRP